MNKLVNFEVGLQDLLFSGASSFILLFFIFSIKIGGESLKKNVNEKDRNSNFIGRASLVDEYFKEGSMKSVRVVEISGLSNEVFERLKSNPGIGGWDLSDYSPEERIKISNQVFAYNGKISYLLITDTLKSGRLDFYFKSAELGRIKESDKEVKFRAKIVEGESIKFSSKSENNKRFNGFVASPIEDIVLKRTINVSFKIDEVDHTHRLFQINQE
ncbi:hypothetical protein QQ020_23290 [Fulvivirgaceae bacterium BMA12]|uniref:Uncharacterized protein n=1 Tax=Agaribacillus aureus TaxID=3051825 RepID=A0ABT8LB78_9BACT|nr:hypothetical protein [Fulvivirgaceae bacterium BMA12]